MGVTGDADILAATDAGAAKGEDVNVLEEKAKVRRLMGKENGGSVCVGSLYYANKNQIKKACRILQ